VELSWEDVAAAAAEDRQRRRRRQYMAQCVVNAELNLKINNKKLVPCGTDGRLLMSGFQSVVTLTLTLDRVIQHTVMHHSSTSIYTPNFIEIGQTFCGRMDGRTDVPTDGRAFPPLILLCRL